MCRAEDPGKNDGQVQRTLGRVTGKCRDRNEIRLSGKQKGIVQVSEGSGRRSWEVGLTKGQVSEVVGQGKELYPVSKYSQGQARVCTGETGAADAPFIICV